MKTVTIFYNPKSGQKHEELAKEVKSFFIENHFNEKDINIITPKSAEESFQLAKKASQNKVDIVIPLGGDGTINKVCAGVYEGGSFSKIGLVPAGTVNNFAKALDIPLNTQEALESLLDGYTQTVDMCKVNQSYMISSLTLGIMADIASHVTPEVKRKYGPLAFIKDGYRIIRRNRSYVIKLEYDQVIKIIKTKFLLITMTNSIAGRPAFSPDAKVDDGLFRVYSLKDIHFFKLLFHLKEFRKGKFDMVPEMDHFNTDHLVISPISRKKRANPFTRIDGDKSDPLPVDIKIINKAINVIVPKK
ncbi:YegS//BmrU family lipid kinase [Streptococcus urinalis FB127-CNA-2]|uniref:Lipid kinase, YegS/Rv2252/BmrU family n=1 Tax=Streptococcus urinalis 2285-97 TaxID=764291 RepID=G5KG60_9STRE|nr:diacylglycerol kinase family protein [Streptococcus urinalis]EHJ56377.1 lipid kinase, YegS/Rv2252/BmrU family [Streptococcus urinalis 2285-97]EKS22270.1 YegS//BmrU family lipid kinase [Streptococcus urinalis FB127-CNA-2]VEF32082.1 Transcription regulator [contains diacylglycerol kinase catalytic domain] [Streptococcus urinalis]